MLIYGNETQWSKSNEVEQAKMHNKYGEFTKNIIARGHYKGGNQLDRTSTATTLRVRDGKRVVTDGPFAETKEQLGGYYLIKAKDLDDAIAIAARVPSVRSGSIEVRPIIMRSMPS